MHASSSTVHSERYAGKTMSRECLPVCCVDGRCEFGLCLFLSLLSEVRAPVLELATVARWSVLLVYP